MRETHTSKPRVIRTEEREGEGGGEREGGREDGKK